MIVVVCAGGPSAELADMTSYQGRQDVYWIGADRGAYHLMECGITPHLIVGDFDSVTNVEWAALQQHVSNIEKVPAQKDETDTELALKRALEQKPSELILTGVTGGRLDHYEAAVRALYRVQTLHPNVQCAIVNNANKMRFLLPGKHHLTYDVAYRYVSFFAYVGEMNDVTLRGVQYETTRQQITRGSVRFTSNEIISQQATVEFSSGVCLMIYSIDA